MGLDELKKLWNDGADRFNTWDELGLDEIVAFAMEVEREACAKVCESTYPEMGDDGQLEQRPHYDGGEECAAAIRSRTP